MITRRQFLGTASAALAGCGFVSRPGMAMMTAEGFSEQLNREMAGLEVTSGGRLGVAVLDTGTGNRAAHRSEERFPMCSTFKLLAAAGVLAKVDAGRERLDRLISFEQKDVVAYSPVTESRVGGKGMSVAEICAAAITLSDNTAGNLLLGVLGGPAGLTGFAHSIGDNVTRLDRTEPDLNEALPGDLRDTTTPAAMLSNLHSLTLGQVLSTGSRTQLTQWLLGNKTGDQRLRARLPKGWRVGDKTGSGERGSTNDVGIIWPTGRPPVIVCVYLTGTDASGDQRNATVAAIGHAVSEALGR